MAYVNSVPKLYRSVIEDVIEGVRDLFAEEGIEEQVLKDLKQLWETKVLQSKATEDFFRNSVHSPLFTLQLPHSLHQTLQSSTASLVIPAGRTLPSFTTAELGASNSSANFTFPGYPIHVPADVTLQTASGHLYKVNVPIMVTQASGRASILQHPIQVFQQLGQPSVIQTSVPRLNPCSLQATTEKSQGMETVFQQPTILHSGTMDRKPLENATSDILVTPGNEHKIMSEALLSQPEGSQYISLPGVVFPPQVSQTVANGEPLLRVSANVTQNLHGGPLPLGLQGAQHQHMSDVQLHVLKNRIFGYDCVKQPRHIEEPSSLSVSDKFLFSLAEFGALYINDGAPEMLGDMWFCRFSKESIAIYFSTLACINAKIQPIIQKEVSLAAMKLKYISTKDSNSQMDLSIQGTDDDINEIIQIDGTGDTSSTDDIGSSRDVDENEFLGIIDGGDLKVLEEADSISNGGSTANSSDNEDPQIDIVEEDPLNSGDDVSEQDAPDLFDTDNVIVCQYDKIHRSKNKWKFYLKDGVMCFGGRDYVFAKAIGDAEW